MFLSYELKKYLGYDSKTNLYSWEYKIIDSEFEDICEASAVAIAVINTYEKRNLNIAASLVKAFIWQSKISDWSISDIVKWNKQWNPKFARYEEDVNKYLMLM